MRRTRDDDVFKLPSHEVLHFYAKRSDADKIVWTTVLHALYPVNDQFIDKIDENCHRYRMQCGRAMFCDVSLSLCRSSPYAQLTKRIVSRPRTAAVACSRTVTWVTDLDMCQRACKQ